MRKDLRHIVHQCTPPILSKWVRRIVPRAPDYRGDYPSLRAARAVSIGYDAQAILEGAREATRRVIAGDAFPPDAFRLPLLSALLRAKGGAARPLRVLDYGGALGNNYFVCRRFCSALTDMEWFVVDQPHIVLAGREEFETEKLHFIEDIGDCDAPDIVVASGVLQFLDDPYEAVDRLAIAPQMLIDRTPFIARPEDRLTVQRVASGPRPISYPARLFGTAGLRRQIESRWNIVAEFSAMDGAFDAYFGRIEFKGFVLDRV
jgi:putative methyltransferase (TIGR04325 family)